MKIEVLKAGSFERRGREGYAEDAKEFKKVKDSILLFDPFCVLCETFAASAFKKFFQ